MITHFYVITWDDSPCPGLCSGSAAGIPGRPGHMTLGSGTPAAGRRYRRSDACISSHSWQTCIRNTAPILNSTLWLTALREHREANVWEHPEQHKTDAENSRCWNIIQHITWAAGAICRLWHVIHGRSLGLAHIFEASYPITVWSQAMKILQHPIFTSPTRACTGYKGLTFSDYARQIFCSV